MQREELNRWVKALTITAFVFLLWTYYLVLRRGYFNLYILNKVAGSAAAVVAAVTLLIGPLSRRFSNFIQFMTIRRHLGLAAFGLAIFHFVASTFFLPDHFTIAGLVARWPSMLPGLVAVLIWVYLAFISRNSKIISMGAQVWKKHQQLFGWLAFIAVYLHLVIMKYQGWLTWFAGKTKQTPELFNPSYPPASLGVLVAMTGVLVYRIGLNLFRKK